MNRVLIAVICQYLPGNYFMAKGNLQAFITSARRVLSQNLVSMQQKITYEYATKRNQNVRVLKCRYSYRRIDCSFLWSWRHSVSTWRILNYLDKYKQKKNKAQTCTHIKKLHGLSPRANYTDRVTTACRRSDCQLLPVEGATWSAWRIPTAVFLIF
jgi:hypothetical protein